MPSNFSFLHVKVTWVHLFTYFDCEGLMCPFTQGLEQSAFVLRLFSVKSWKTRQAKNKLLPDDAMITIHYFLFYKLTNIKENLADGNYMEAMKLSPAVINHVIRNVQPNIYGAKRFNIPADRQSRQKFIKNSALCTSINRNSTQPLLSSADIIKGLQQVVYMYH